MFDAVNVDPGLAQATSISVATELEARGMRIVDAEASMMSVDARPPDESLGELGIKSDTAVRLGATHYVDGSLVGLGRTIQIRAAIHTLDGEVLATKKVQVTSQNDLPRAVTQIVDVLVEEPSDVPTEITQPAVESVPNATAPTPNPSLKKKVQKPPSEKNFGLIFGQAFGFGEMTSFSQIGFELRFELDNLFIGVTPCFGFGEDGIGTPQFIFDTTVAYYITRTRVAPYIGAGIGLFVGNRLGADNPDDDYSLGWTLFPTIGVELLRHTFMRIHIDFRYIFNYSMEQFGHAPMALAGVNF